MSFREYLFSVVLLASSINANAGLFGFGGTSWKEEALLHDGSKIVVQRSVERGGRHEIGQSPPYKEQSLSFSLPGAGRTVTWEDHYSEDLGSANFLPMLLDIFNGIPYIIAYPMGCLGYNKWGRPNPPYVIFKYDGNEWKRIPLEELPAEIKRPNLIFSAPDVAVEKLGTNYVTAETIQEIIGKYRQPEYKTILRESLANAADSCGEMVSDGHGGWTGIGWFKKQPTREACLKFCEREKIGSQHCPCETLFKDK